MQQTLLYKYKFYILLHNRTGKKTKVINVVSVEETQIYKFKHVIGNIFIDHN